MENQEKRTIDVKKIMEKIQVDIIEKGYSEDLPDFADEYFLVPPINRGEFEAKELQLELQNLKGLWEVQCHRQLSGDGVVGKMKVFIKRVIRKSVKFYVKPIVEEQNMFNARVAKMFDIMNLYIEKAQKENEELKRRIEQLEEK